jgi:hypothetical protein
MEVQGRITKKRDDIQLKDQVNDQQINEAEKVYKEEITTFKTLFGDTPISNIDWEIKRDWAEILNKRWMKEYHS